MDSSTQIRILSRKDVAQVLHMNDAIDAMRQAFRALWEGRAQVPQRLNMSLTAGKEPSIGEALFMPVFTQGMSTFGVKTVTIVPNNPSRSLPLIHGLVTLLDAETGQPRAIMDGEWLTAMRTGAASGLATDLLARKDARVATIFGAGAQAETQLMAIAHVRQLEMVHVVGRSEERTIRFCKTMADKLNIPVHPGKADEATAAADIICAATTATQPIFDPEHVSPGCHINGVGSYRKDMVEIPPETVGRAHVVADSRDACAHEAGELVAAQSMGILSESDIGELGAVVAGSWPERTNPKQITFFKSVGNAVQDLAVAALVLERATALNLGTVAPL